MRLQSSFYQTVDRGPPPGGEGCGDGGELLQLAFLPTTYYNSRIYYYIRILYGFEMFMFVVMRTKYEEIYNPVSIWYFLWLRAVSINAA